MLDVASAGTTGTTGLGPIMCELRSPAYSDETIAEVDETAPTFHMRETDAEQSKFWLKQSSVQNYYL